MPRYEIGVIEAQGLPSADLNGKSDPYIEVCSSVRQKTEVKKATLNPVWRETKIVTVANPATDAIGFIVYDWDRLGANDIIAYGFISVIGVPPNGAPLDAWVALYKKSKKDQKKVKKAKSGKIPKPGTPGGRLHLTVRALDPMPMAGPMPGQPPMGYPPQPMPGQPPMGYPPQPMPGQPPMGYPPQGYPPQPMPGQPPMGYPPQPMPGYPPQPMPGYPPQPMPGYAPAPMAYPGFTPLIVPSPYVGAIPAGFQNKSGFLRVKRTDAEVAGKVVGKGAKKTLKVLGKLL